jgi:hypothetical protein
MDIKTALQTGQNYSMQILFGQTPANQNTSAKAPSRTEQNASGRDASLSLSLSWSGKTEITLQAKQIENYFSGDDQQTKNEDATASSPLDAFNNGPWGIDQTAGRIANFVLAGAGDDADRLRLGRDAIMQGFKDAEKAWGGKLPDISYQTINQAVSLIDQKLNSLNQPVVDEVV